VFQEEERRDQEAPGARRRANIAPKGARDRAKAAGGVGDLAAEEVLDLLPSLDMGALTALRDHEAAGAAREDVLRAIDELIAGPGSSG
jgi:hypothetical protein